MLLIYHEYITYFFILFEYITVILSESGTLQRVYFFVYCIIVVLSISTIGSDACRLLGQTYHIKVNRQEKEWKNTTTKLSIWTLGGRDPFLFLFNLLSITGLMP